MALPPLEFYEIHVDGKLRLVEVDRAEADRLAWEIACDELAEVEVRPIGPKKN